MEDLLQQIADKLYDGDRDAVSSLTQQALDGGLTPGEVLKGGLQTGMDRVGVDFRAGELFVPEVLIAARAMHAGMDILKPLLTEGETELVGKVVIGTVEGDLHDIGKNLVAMMVEGAGFEINDLGTDVDPQDFVAAVREGANIVGLSALLTTTMPMIEKTIQAIDAAGLRDQAKIIVGGAPVTAEFAEQIGADGYAPDASQAARLAKSFIA